MGEPVKHTDENLSDKQPIELIQVGLKTPTPWIMHFTKVHKTAYNRRMKTTNRVNQKAGNGMNLMSIMDEFSTDEKARRKLESFRWPKGRTCPHCGSVGRSWPIKASVESEVRPGLYECADCHKQFSVTVGTIFESSHVPLRKWLIAWYLACSSKKGVSALQLQRQLGLGSYRTAWFMLHRIRYALRDPEFTAPKLGGKGRVVETDETWIGGRKRGMGRAYTGNKTAVVSTVERDGRVRSKAITNVTSANFESVLRSHVEENTRLYTDGHPGYTSVGRAFRAHQTVKHAAGEYVRNTVHTNTAEGYFANLKRGPDGIYHHVGSHYLSQYLAEFDFRYNTRKLTDGDRTIIGVRKVNGKRLMLRRTAA
jgi:transposase-like protein